MKTILKSTIVEFEEKKSKFICSIKPVNSVDEAKKFIEITCEQNKAARHNIPVYRIYENGQEFLKYSDDGEPKNTAGKPAADILVVLDVHNVAMVITRYFGGIKLGAGGLIRAYAKSAKLGVDEAEIIDLVEKKKICIDISYSRVGELDRFIELKDIKEVDKEFGETVIYRFEINVEEIDRLKEINGIIVID